MKMVLFSKHWPEVSIEEMIRRTLRLGADGLDLAVRARMAVDIVGQQLCAVPFKDTFFQRQNAVSEGLPSWRRAIVPAGSGAVCWLKVLKALHEAQFSGPLSVHCEFAAESPEAFAALQEREVAFLRQQAALVPG